MAFWVLWKAKRLPQALIACKYVEEIMVSSVCQPEFAHQNQGFSYQ
jgi:hypothetical protein